MPNAIEQIHQQPYINMPDVSVLNHDLKVNDEEEEEVFMRYLTFARSELRQCLTLDSCYQHLQLLNFHGFY